MPWEKFRRDDRIQGANEPFIAISGAHFAFSSQFVQRAGLTSDLRVTVYIDSEARKIGFEFHADQRPDSFALSYQSSHKPGQKRKGLQATARAVVQKYPWLKEIAGLPAKARRFQPKEEGEFWTIELSPPLK